MLLTRCCPAHRVSLPAALSLSARPLAARSPSISTADSADWTELKPRVRAELEHDPGAVRQVASPSWP
jgi:hypothetical protein